MPARLAVESAIASDGSSSVDLSRLIDDAPIRTSHILLLLLCMAVALVDGYDTQALAYALSSIAAEWHVSPASFAPAFTSGLFGLAIGAIAFGQLGDRFGRKPLILVAVALFGLCTLTISVARDLSDLVVLRLLIGIGLGGVLPNAVTLVADVSPLKYRRPAVMVVMGCLAAGAFLGGLAAGALIPHFGWRSVFYVGGGSSLVAFAICTVALSESPLFLALRHGATARAARVASRFVADVGALRAHTFLVTRTQGQRQSVRRLFENGRAPITLLLWITMVIQLLILYTLVLWLPTLVKNNGNSLELSLFVSALFSLGGLVGSATLGFVARRFGAHPTLATCYVIVAGSCLALSEAGTDATLLCAFASLAGVFTFGAWSTLTALMADFYPPAVRSTGLGYGTGVGRFGSMAGPGIVGFFLASGLGAQGILRLPIVPALVAALCIVCIAKLRGGRRSDAARPPQTSTETS